MQPPHVRYLFSFLFMALFVSNSSFAQENQQREQVGQQTGQTAKIDPRQKIDTAVKFAIKLLEEEKHDELLKKFMPPKTLEMAIKDLGSMEALHNAFKNGNADELLLALRSIKDKKPTLKDDGNTAVFMVDDRTSGHAELTFQKVDNYWRIKN